MKVKVLLYLAFALASLLLAWGGARADVSVEAPGPSTLHGYRDGARWISFARSGEFQHGREWLVLRASRRSFRAQVGPHAVLQVRHGLRDARRAHARLRQLRVRMVRALSPALGIYLVASERAEDGAALAARLSTERDLESVAPDLYTPRRRAAITLPPNDPRYGGQWYLQAIRIEDAWRISSGARDVTVAVVDDGCDLAHPDLAAQFVAGADVFAGDDDPSFVPNQPNNSHGTACAGIVAAAPNNRVGIAGTCPECTLSCVRLLNNFEDQGVPWSADIAAFDFAFRSGAAVVSNSWSFAESVPVSSALAAAIRRVAEQGNGGRGAVVVFAAGNEGRELLGDEVAALPFVLAVGAVNRFDESAPFGNFGAALDLSAPAGSLTTDISGPDGSDPGDFTNLFGGTSAACPVVAGVAGLAMAAARGASAADVRRALVESARPAPFATPDAQGHDPVYGRGIVDPAAALRALGAGAPDAGSAQDAGSDAAVVASEAGAASRDAGALDAASAHEAAAPAPVDAGTEPARPTPGRADQPDAQQLPASEGDAGAAAGAADGEHDDEAPDNEPATPGMGAQDHDDTEHSEYESESSAASAAKRGADGCTLGARGASPIAWSSLLLALTLRACARGRCARRSTRTSR